MNNYLNVTYLKDLKNGLSDDSALIIRHGDRQSCDNVDERYLRLTSKGVEKSKQLGIMLSKGPLPGIVASPRLRCIETGRFIMEGLGRETTLCNSNLLGEHGPFVFDSTLAGESFSTLGLEEVVRNQMLDKVYPGVRPLHEGSWKLLRHAYETVKEDGATIMISHDAILMPFIAYFTGYCFDADLDWLSPLDGVVVRFEDGRAEFSFGRIRSAVDI